MFRTILSEMLVNGYINSTNNNCIKKRTNVHGSTKMYIVQYCDLGLRVYFFLFSFYSTLQSKPSFLLLCGSQ